MTKQVVIAFVAGTPVEIAYMVTTVLAEGKIVLEALIPLAGEAIAAVFNRSNGDREPDTERRLTFVSYAVFSMPDDTPFDTRARVHVQSLGITEASETPASTIAPPGPRVQ
jgi:hypothetical protein